MSCPCFFFADNFPNSPCQLRRAKLKLTHAGRLCEDMPSRTPFKLPRGRGVYPFWFSTGFSTEGLTSQQSMYISEARLQLVRPVSQAFICWRMRFCKNLWKLLSRFQMESDFKFSCYARYLIPGCLGANETTCQMGTMILM